MINYETTSEFIRRHVRNLLERNMGCVPYSVVGDDVAETYLMRMRVDHSCGHPAEPVSFRMVELKNGRSYLLNTHLLDLQKARSSACEDCFIENSKNWDTLPDLPELKGTPKQVAWARSHRARAIKRFGELIIPLLPMLTESAWWLDNNNRIVHQKIWNELEMMDPADLKVMMDTYAEKRSKYVKA